MNGPGTRSAPAPAFIRPNRTSAEHDRRHGRKPPPAAGPGKVEDRRWAHAEPGAPVHGHGRRGRRPRACPCGSHRRRRRRRRPGRTGRGLLDRRQQFGEVANVLRLRDGRAGPAPRTRGTAALGSCAPRPVMNAASSRAGSQGRVVTDEWWIRNSTNQPVAVGSRRCAHAAAAPGAAPSSARPRNQWASASPPRGSSVNSSTRQRHPPGDDLHRLAQALPGDRRAVDVHAGRSPAATREEGVQPIAGVHASTIARRRRRPSRRR